MASPTVKAPHTVCGVYSAIVTAQWGYEAIAESHTVPDSTS